MVASSPLGFHHIGALVGAGTGSFSVGANSGAIRLRARPTRERRGSEITGERPADDTFDFMAPTLSPKTGAPGEVLISHPLRRNNAQWVEHTDRKVTG